MKARHRERLTIIQAHALLYTRGDILADFEIELIRDVHSRLIRPAVVATSVTASEWRVIEDAVAAMRVAPRQDDMELAA